MNKKCQIFTPERIVFEMTNLAGYKTNLYGKKVMENSCGDGSILEVIVKRYIIDCLECELSIEQIKQGLENDIVGYEIDKDMHRSCIARLQSVASLNGIDDVQWKIYNSDFLKEDIDEKYDYILGNPPYISYKDLTIKSRDFIKQSFVSCKSGKPDYCYPFIEKSVGLLSYNGILVYLVPMSIFRNVFAENLRDLLKDDIQLLYDYSNLSLFKGVTTSSAIFRVQKGSNAGTLAYKHVDSKVDNVVPKERLGKIWMFSSLKNNGMRRLGDYFKVQNSVATLRNKIFIFEDYYEGDNFLHVGKYKIEKELIYKAASPKGVVRGKNELALFPYIIEKNGIVKGIEEEIFYNNYPKAYEYLSSKKKELLKRKFDNNSKWYEYGRRQALGTIKDSKLLISKVITNRPQVFILDANVVSYSGIIICKNGDIELTELKVILESKDFYDYVCNVGTNMSGNSIQLSSTIISEYRF